MLLSAQVGEVVELQAVHGHLLYAEAMPDEADVQAAKVDAAQTSLEKLEAKMKARDAAPRGAEMNARSVIDG